MKAYLRELIAPVPSTIEAIHVVREYLQARILQSLQRSDAMRSIAFHGGTSLRFLYSIPRYSEDLDFALENNRDEYDFRGYLRQIVSDFSAEAYTVDVKVNDKRTVHKAFVRFRGLLHELGLSGHESEVIAIKIEVDTNPPSGAIVVATPLTRYVPLHLVHHDSATLLSGKLHAILQRAYLKGRDIFDLSWYLGQETWPEPNLSHLNFALAQTDWEGESLTLETWRDAIVSRLNSAEWKAVQEDVEPFIMSGDVRDVLNKERVMELLTARKPREGWDAKFQQMAAQGDDQLADWDVE